MRMFHMGIHKCQNSRTLEMREADVTVEVDFDRLLAWKLGSAMFAKAGQVTHGYGAITITCHNRKALQG